MAKRDIRALAIALSLAAAALLPAARAADSGTLVYADAGESHQSGGFLAAARAAISRRPPPRRHSTVTVLARFRGWSTFKPRSRAM